MAEAGSSATSTTDAAAGGVFRDALAGVRNLRAFQRDVLAFFADKQGPRGVDAFPLGVRRAVLVTEPGLVAAAIDHPALVRDRRPMGPFGSFGGYAPIHAVIGEGLPLLNEGVLERRRRVAGLLKEGDAGSSVDVDDFAAFVDVDVDLAAVVTRSVLRRLALRLFGDPCRDALDTLAHALEQTTRFGHQQSVGAPVWARFYGAAHEGIAEARAALEAFAVSILDDPRFATAPAVRAFADAPRALQIDEIITQVLAGTETTSLAICWTTWLLAEHQEWLDAVRVDVDAVRAGSLDVRTLRLGSERALVRCVREALRLYPSFWQLFRVARERCEIGGVPVDVDDVVFCCLYLAHRFPPLIEPDAFQPAREGAPFLAFGVGGRGCIGARLGFTLVMETLVDLFGVVDVDVRDRTRPVEPLVHGLHRRGGFPCRLRARA